MFSFKKMQDMGIEINPDSEIATKFRSSLSNLDSQEKLDELLTCLCDQAVSIRCDIASLDLEIESHNDKICWCQQAISELKNEIYNPWAEKSRRKRIREYNQSIIYEQQKISYCKRDIASLKQKLVAPVTSAYILATETAAKSNEIALGEPGATTCITSAKYYDLESFERRSCKPTSSSSVSRVEKQTRVVEALKRSHRLS